MSTVAVEKEVRVKEGLGNWVRVRIIWFGFNLGVEGLKRGNYLFEG